MENYVCLTVERLVSWVLIRGLKIGVQRDMKCLSRVRRAIGTEIIWNTEVKEEYALLGLKGKLMINSPWESNRNIGKTPLMILTKHF